MEFENSWALEVERAILNYKLNPKAQKGGRKLKPIFLPEKPEENWTYKGKEIKPICLLGQK